MVSKMASILDFREMDCPLSYFGLPSSGNPNSKGFWDPMVEKVAQRLDGWEKDFLSLGGRITLIQACLTHIPNYFLFLYRIIILVAIRLEKL